MLYTDTFFLKFKKITNITITNRKNLKIVLSSIGASIFKCYIGNRKVSYGPRYLVDFMSSPDFYGKTCGRTAGRIRQGIVEINNKTYHLKKGKIHSLHGGFGFAFKKLYL